MNVSRAVRRVNAVLEVMAVVAILLGASIHLGGQMNIDVHSYLRNKEGVQGKLNLSLTLQKGQVEMTQFSNSVSLGYLKGKNAILLTGNTIYGKTNDVLSSDYLSTEFRYGRILGDMFSLEIFGHIERDKVKRVKQRYWVGAGVRTSLPKWGVKPKKITFSCGSALLYLSEKYYETLGSEESPDSGKMRSANYVSFNWNLNKSVSFTCYSFFMFALKSFKQNDFETQLALNTTLNDHFTFVNSFFYTYDNTPASGVKKYFSRLSSGATWSF